MNKTGTESLVEFILNEVTIDVDLDDQAGSKKAVATALRKGGARVQRDNIKSANKERKDAAKSSGKTKSIDQQIASLKSQLAVLQARRSKMRE